MTRILAIEPDAERGAQLERLVRQKLDADVVLAACTEAAIAAITRDTPDLILTSSLIPPDEDRYLSGYLRQVPAIRHVPILTIPPVSESGEVVSAKPRGLLSRLLPARSRTWPTYDFDAVATRIQDTLDEARLAGAANQHLRGSHVPSPVLETMPLAAAPSSTALVPITRS